MRAIEGLMPSSSGTCAQVWVQTVAHFGLPEEIQRVCWLIILPQHLQNEEGLWPQIWPRIR